MSQQSVAGQVALGAFASYLTHPLVWLVGPARWVAFVVGTARQESNFNPDATAAEANGTTSWGVLQFNDVRLAEIGGRDVALSPLAAGYATGGYATRRILEHPAYLLLLPIPVLGWAWFRRLWQGPADASEWYSPAVHVDVLSAALEQTQSLRLVAWLRFLTLTIAVPLGYIGRTR